MRSTRNVRSPCGGAVVGVDVPVAAHAADAVRLDLSRADALAAARQVLHAHDAVLADAGGEHREHVLRERARSGLGRLLHRVAAERRLDLGAHGRERRARVGRDERADQVERQQQGLRLERREARRLAEVVAVQLLLDRHDRLLLDELGVDGVAASAEAHEVQQLQMLLERLGHEPVARGEGDRGDARARLVAAGCEQIGHQRLQDGEALRGDRALATASGRLAGALDERRRSGVRRRPGPRAPGPRDRDPAVTSSTRSGGPSGTAWPSRSSSQRASSRASAKGVSKTSEPSSW